MAHWDLARNRLDRVASANIDNNARSDRARRTRWKPARDAAWALLEDVLLEGAAVAVVGAGNGDDLPLGRLARRCARLDLLDLDATALARAVEHAGGAPARAVVEDVTLGAADAVLAAALNGGGEPAAGDVARGRPSASGGEAAGAGDATDGRPSAGGGETAALGDVAGSRPSAAPVPLPGAPFDVVVCDLVLTQLLYPALKAARALSGRQVDDVLLAEGQPLTDAVIARLHDSAPTVVVLHDLLGWWKGHQQPFALRTLLDLPADRALTRARGGSLPYGCDPWRATRAAGAHVTATRHWRWPFAPGADYLVFGLVTSRRGAGPAARPRSAAPPGRLRPAPPT